VNNNVNTIKDLRNHLHLRLGNLYPANEIDSIAIIIIKTLSGLDRLHQLQNPDYRFSGTVKERLYEICEKLAEGMPVQYALGETVFYGYRIKVNNKTLIPRQETEELVDLIIRENKGFSGRILDIGTGSGTIAIALAGEMPLASVSATDISEEALETAKENASLNKVNITFFRADILSPHIEMKVAKFNIIASNPPYIPESEKKNLHVNITEFEPASALFVPDSDPLVYYRAILKKKDFLLEPGGRLYFEMHEKMGIKLKSLALHHGFTDVRIIKDLNNKDRFLTCTFNG